MSQTVELLGDLVFDRAARALVRDGAEQPLSPKLFDLLVALVDARDRVMTKQELLDRVWEGDAVVPEVLTTAMRALRTQLGDSVDEPRFIRTVRGAGYRFVAPVVMRDVGLAGPAPSVVRERHAHFVGREVEVDRIFRALLGDDGARLVHVHGPGGIGKTSVLQELVLGLAARELPFAELHAEHVAAQPRSFEHAVALAFGCEHFAELGHKLRPHARSVLLVDGLESLHTLGNWFLDALLPRLPDSVLLVIASRAAPPRRWLSDPAWCGMALEVALAPLDDAASRLLLAGRGLTGERAEPVLAFAKGHPLALALGAAVVERGVDPREVPRNRDVIDALVDVFAAHAPSPEHRRALEAASLLTSIDENLLALLSASDRATDIYAWLGGLAFVRRTDSGLRVHELVRQALLDSLRWRNEEQFRRLAMRCYLVHLDLLESTSDRAARMALTKRIMSLGRHHPVLRPLYASEDASHPLLRLATQRNEREAAVGLVEHHEGAESAGHLRRWLELGMGDLWLVDDGSQTPAGISLVLRLAVEELATFEWDPAVAMVRRYLGAKRSGTSERIVLHRWLVARDEYQTPGAVMQRAHEIVNDEMHTLSSDLTHTFVVYGEPELWAGMMAVAHFEPVSVDRFAAGSHRCGVYVRSWIDVPFRDWIRRIVETVVGARGVATPSPAALRA